MDTPNSTQEKPAQIWIWLRSAWKWLAGLVLGAIAVLAGILVSRRNAKLAALDRTVEQINKSTEAVAKLEAKKVELVAELVSEAAREAEIAKDTHALSKDEVTRRLRARGLIK